MKVSRRDFIKISGFSAIGSGVLITNSQNILGQSIFKEAPYKADLLFSLKAETFNKVIGQDFTFFTEEAAFQGTLSEVNINTVKGPKQNLLFSKRTPITSDCFYLKFKVQTPNLPQATYTLNQSQLGQFDLFLVPGETNGYSTMMTALINRL